jgi:hypothetical protein
LFSESADPRSLGALAFPVLPSLPSFSFSGGLGLKKSPPSDASPICGVVGVSCPTAFSVPGPVAEMDPPFLAPVSGFSSFSSDIAFQIAQIFALDYFDWNTRVPEHITAVRSIPSRPRKVIMAICHRNRDSLGLYYYRCN